MLFDGSKENEFGYNVTTSSNKVTHANLVNSLRLINVAIML